MDNISKEKRSLIMRKVKGRDTVPELKVRSMLHRMGYRFRLNKSKLPGRPDIVLPKWNTVIFVHGCFWHRHNCKNGIRIPASRQDYWIPKLRGNQERDKKNILQLKEMGWKILVIWECEIKHENRLLQKISTYFNSINI